jgi:hypothetical protein
MAHNILVLVSVRWGFLVYSIKVLTDQGLPLPHKLQTNATFTVRPNFIPARR